VRAKIAAGAEFAEMAKLHSDDAASAANGGDMGVIAPDDRSVSENIRQMLARMQPGQLSAPVKEGARYYLFKVTAADARPLEEVRPQILQMVQGAKLKERLDQIREDVKIIYDDPAYLSARPGN
jgi:parvulin-like peptidyl-prolyl isomerase